METIAVYWEPVIKTYGFQKKSDLSFIKIEIPENHLVDIGLRLREQKKIRIEYQFCELIPSESKTLALFLLLERRREKDFEDAFQDLREKYVIESVSPVDLVFFQGPHFGDRYGIADAAFNALLTKGIYFLLAGCSGASIYLVFQEGMGAKAILALNDTFQTPI
ncbi:hypothetical protein ACFL9U_04190 [Thermodesulfobacteriota bacterium]